MTPERERLVLDHRNLVPAALRSLGGMRRYADREGLIGAGNEALVQAALRFDPSKGLPFRKFAFIRIRGAMVDETRRGFGTRRSHDDGIEVYQAAAALLQDLARAPSPAEVAVKLAWPVERVEKALRDTEQTYLLSLDACIAEPVSAGREAVELNGPEATYCDAETVREVHAAIVGLPPRYRDIVIAHYLEGRSQVEIGKEYGLTRSRINQLLRAAYKRLEPVLAPAFNDAA